MPSFLYIEIKVSGRSITWTLSDRRKNEKKRGIATTP